MVEAGMGSTTRDQVALRAGVSSATVSRVYNHPEQVSSKKREAVFEASRELGYVPNKTASSLRRSGTGTITLIECAKPPRAYYWGSLRSFSWFFADVIHGIQEMIDRTMYTLQLKRVHDLNELPALAMHTDGIICFDVDRQEEADAAAGLGIPYILAHHTESFHDHPRCSTDNRKGGYLQAAYLAEAGCSRAWYLTSYLEIVAAHRERLEGFLEGAHTHRLDVSIESGLESPKGRRACVRRIAGRKDTEYGIASVNDLTLIQTRYTCSELGLPSALDVPSVGYDAMPVRDLLPVSFASIDLRPSAVYRRAAEMLVRMISGSGEDTAVSDTVEPVLIPGPSQARGQPHQTLS